MGIDQVAVEEVERFDKVDSTLGNSKTLIESIQRKLHTISGPVENHNTYTGPVFIYNPGVIENPNDKIFEQIDKAMRYGSLSVHEAVLEVFPYSRKQ